MLLVAVFARVHTSLEDFMVDPRNILLLWRARKLSHAQAIEQLHLCRGFNTKGGVAEVEYIMAWEKRQAAEKERKRLTQMLSTSMRPFITHDVVEKWKQQYMPSSYGNIRRFELLLLRGPSRMGKTCYAESLFGEEFTLVVQCQGLDGDLPSLREFDRDVHRCIVFDEIEQSQVLKNKALFQAGKNIVDLAQSRCGGFRYSIWPYQIAMICCSNKFAMSVEEGLEDPEDENWLRGNVRIAELGPDQTWFAPCPGGAPDSADPGAAARAVQYAAAGA